MFKKGQMTKGQKCHSWKNSKKEDISTKSYLSHQIAVLTKFIFHAGIASYTGKLQPDKKKHFLTIASIVPEKECFFQPSL